MQIKISTDYAVRMVMYLAIKGGVVASSELSEVMVIPRKYLINITKNLRTAGILKAHSGLKGGYSLGVSAGDLTLFDIIECMEGTAKLNRCLEEDAYCSRYATNSCPVRRFYEDLQDTVSGKLKSITVQKLIDEMN